MLDILNYSQFLKLVVELGLNFPVIGYWIAIIDVSGEISSSIPQGDYLSPILLVKNYFVLPSYEV